MVSQFHCDLGAPAAPLPHFWEECVGSGRAVLALRADLQQQLRRTHEELGMRQVRFHGLLSDDMGTLICHREQLLYSFFNIDRICDFLLSVGMRPFIELSFMPRTLASGDTTVFAYEANVTPPRDYRQWQDLVSRLATHLLARYGTAELRTWNFEVWNEPNQPQFWPASRDAYFRLYDASYDALKQADGQLRVGGPATSKNAWLPEFLDHCSQAGRPPDFVSTHHYPTDAFGEQSDDTLTQLEHAGRSVLREQARVARAQAGELPLYYTEWCTSSNPRDPLHDAPYAAAFIVKTVLEAQGLADAYSYWTFSDIFAENYFPSLPFHGGFGLLNLHGIAKPAYRAFQLLHAAGDRLLSTRGQHATVDLRITQSDQGLQVFIVNSALPRHPIGTETVELILTGVTRPGAATLQRLDEWHGNAVAAWRAMGAPEYLSAPQLAGLDAASRLQAEPLPYELHGDRLSVTVTVPPQGVAVATIPFDGQAHPAQPVLDVNIRTDLARRASDDAMLDEVQRETFDYFLYEYNTTTGLVGDCTRPGWPASIATTGMGLSCFPIAIERGYCERAMALQRTLTTLRFFHRSAQDGSATGTGYHGFYYHFLDMETGRRVWDAELSTIDTALLLAGMLTAASYFDGDSADEREVRALTDELFRRVDWPWALNGGAALSHGWQPGGAGFLDYRWEGYSEALLLYVLALGSPSHPLPPSSYEAWASTYQWKHIDGREVLYGGPLFMHQLSHLWLDLRGIQDASMREHHSDYFENSRRATQIHQEYACRNPGRFRTLNPLCWGISAGDGPGPLQAKVDGIDRVFFGYMARGAPFGPDDGTILPSVAVASLPFAPELVLPAMRHYIDDVDLKPPDRYGFKPSFNAEFPVSDAVQQHAHGWVTQWHYGINQGPVVLMIENYRSGLIWRLMRRCPPVVTGLRRAGFSGGWLDLPT